MLSTLTFWSKIIRGRTIHNHYGNHLSLECAELKVSDEEELSDSFDESDSEGEEQEEMVQLMQEMDRQLEGTAVGNTFKEKDADEEETKPVEVDFNLVHSLLESHGAQMGGAGPTSNILHSLGITIPKENHD